MSLKQSGAVTISLLILAGLSWSSYCDYHSLKQLSLAKETLLKGYPRVANELTQKIRKKVKFSKEECDLVLSIDSKLRKSSDLFLNAEKCLFSGHLKGPNPYLAISMAFEIDEDISSAKRILLQAIEKVDFNQSFFFRLASLSFIEDKKDEAVNILSSLIERNKGNEKVILSVIQFFTQRDDWERAYSFIRVIEGIEQLNFETHITLYGVAKKNGDSSRAKIYMDRVTKVLDKLPKDQAQKIMKRLSAI